MSKKALYSYNFKKTFISLFTNQTINKINSCIFINQLEDRRILKNNLVFLNIGLFLIKNLILLTTIVKHKYKYIFKLKKILYTFIKPNQAKIMILKRKSSIILHQLVYKTNYQAQNFTNTVNTFNLLKKKKTLSIFYDLIKSQHNNNWYLNQKKNIGINYSEVKLTRIKFKPGYQRMWREARLALKDSLSLNFTYQKQLTKYITSFYKKSYENYPVISELSVDKVLIYSRLIPDYNTFNLFFYQNSIFINGKLLSSKNINCVVNDFIQFIVTK